MAEKPNGVIGIPKWFVWVVGILVPVLAGWANVEIHQAQDVSEGNRGELVKLNISLTELKVSFAQFTKSQNDIEFLKERVHQGEIDRERMQSEIALLKVRLEKP